MGQTWAVNPRRLRDRVARIDQFPQLGLYLGQILCAKARQFRDDFSGAHTMKVYHGRERADSMGMRPEGDRQQSAEDQGAEPQPHLPGDGPRVFTR